MSQVVGRSCALCGERIGTATEGGFCRACRSPIHARCVTKGPRPAGACPKCGAAEGPAAGLPATAPEPTRTTTENDVRVFGAIAVLLGLLIAVFGGNYVINRAIPLPWAGYFLIAVGLGMLAFPSRFKDRVGRVVQRPKDPWMPPVATTAAAPSDAAFRGTYHSRVFAAQERPFPLRGKGRLALRKAGLEATGVPVATLSGPVSILVVLSICVFGAATVGLMVTTRNAAWLALLLGIPLVCLPFVLKRRKPATIAIPWENVHGFQEDPDRGAVRILVRHMKPKGEIVFVPDDGPEPLLAALIER